MEDSILLYLLKVSIALLLFSIVYILFLRSDTFVKTRRFYFLFTLTFSLLYPLLIIELPVRDESFAIPSYWLSQVEIGNVDTATAKEGLSAVALLVLTMGMVSLLLLCRFCIQVLSVFRLRMVNNVKTIQGYKVVLVADKNISPFSFFNWIFIGRSSLHSDKLSEILIHEHVHAHQWHSLDILLSELFCICFWWNPLVWYIRNEVKINLEYLADKGVLEYGCNSRKYQYMLLHTFTNEKRIPIINNFNVSQLKKRIAMMNKKQTPLTKSLKYLFILPVSFALIAGNAVQASGKMMDITSGIIPSDVPDYQMLSVDTVIPGVETKGKVLKIREVKDAVSQDRPLATVEDMPGYPGGESAMMEFIKANLKYPKSAQDAGIQGRVVMRFVIGKDGSISDVRVLRGVDPECDAEAVRTVNAMPNWTPGRHNGKEVPVYFTLPIVFRLTKDDIEKPKMTTILPNTLIILDGVIIDQKQLSDIKPSDIESMSVLKDAAKVAAYGDAARGKESVIIITTKK